MADCITRMFDKMDKETAEEDNITDMDAMAPVKSSAYQGMKMLDSKTDVTKDNAITSFSSGGFNQMIMQRALFSTSIRDKKARHGSRITGCIRQQAARTL